VDEALWRVAVDLSGRIQYHVWPLFPTPSCITDDVDAALKRRVCGQNPSECGLVKHDNHVNDCVETPTGQFNCKVVEGGEYKPAIKTALRSEGDLDLLYCPDPG
jgi:hypothetical protein